MIDLRSSGAQEVTQADWLVEIGKLILFKNIAGICFYVSGSDISGNKSYYLHLTFDSYYRVKLKLVFRNFKKITYSDMSDKKNLIEITTWNEMQFIKEQQLLEISYLSSIDINDSIIEIYIRGTRGHYLKKFTLEEPEAIELEA